MGSWQPFVQRILAVSCKQCSPFLCTSFPECMDGALVDVMAPEPCQQLFFLCRQQTGLQGRHHCRASEGKRAVEGCDYVNLPPKGMDGKKATMRKCLFIRRSSRCALHNVSYKFVPKLRLQSHGAKYASCPFLKASMSLLRGHATNELHSAVVGSHHSCAHSPKLTHERR